MISEVLCITAGVTDLLACLVVIFPFGAAIVFSSKHWNYDDENLELGTLPNKKRNEPLMHTAAWMHLKIIPLSERHTLKKRYILYDSSHIKL